MNRVRLGYFARAIITIITEAIFYQPYLLFIKTQGEYLIIKYEISGDGCSILESHFSSTVRMNPFLEELNKYA